MARHVFLTGPPGKRRWGLRLWEDARGGGLLQWTLQRGPASQVADLNDWQESLEPTCRFPEKMPGPPVSKFYDALSKL